MLAAVSDASSDHLRRCSDADTIKKSLSRKQDLSILGIMANYHGPLVAVDCHIHSVTNDIMHVYDVCARVLSSFIAQSSKVWDFIFVSNVHVFVAVPYNHLCCFFILTYLV